MSVWARVPWGEWKVGTPEGCGIDSGRKPDARGRGYRPGQGLRRGIQLRFREMAKTIAAGPELAAGSNSRPCRNNALSRDLSCITPPPQQPEPISSPSGWHFQPVGKKIKPERGRKRTRGVLSWDCGSVAVSAQRFSVNIEESRRRIGITIHYKYWRVWKPAQYTIPL